jgi:hypothetical protein
MCNVIYQEYRKYRKKQMFSKYIPMNTDDLPEQNTNEISPPQPPPDHKPPKLNKNGKPRKPLSEEDAKRRAEILKMGREKALAKKKALKEK